MTSKYTLPTVEAIQEDSEDDSAEDLTGKNYRSPNDPSYRQQRRSTGGAMLSPVKANTGREREKIRRKHRSGGGGGRRNRSKKEELETDVRYTSYAPVADNGRTHYRRRRTSSNKSSSSTSSSEEEDEPPEDHREVLSAQAQRTKLTSPSVISTLTTLTTTTNKSSGSSGSNSTVTQASITSKRSLGKRPQLPEAPMSPAVPDAPDVFAFLDNGSTTSLGSDREEEEECEDRGDHQEDGVGSETPLEGHNSTTITPPPGVSIDQANSSSSTSSSFHGSEHAFELSVDSADHDTDRSTSPERSAPSHSAHSDHSDHSEHFDHSNHSDQSDHTDHSEHDEEQNEEDDDSGDDQASAKVASQIAAAQQRQGQYATGPPQSFGTPDMPRGPAVYPYLPNTSALSPRYAQHVQRNLPRAQKLPVTGYELLATRLATSNPKPMYRKFEGLNHRVLLHLQDELSELEERLHRIDHADTQSRQAAANGSVVPASRRAAEAAGGELQWHKTDILGRIGFKLTQYNQALAAHKATQGLTPPDPMDIDQYREYLHNEHPIAEPETQFLDHTDDLVSVSSERMPPYAPSFGPETQTSESCSVAFGGEALAPKPESEVSQVPSQQQQPELSGLAAAVAVSVLIPIILFSVIPGFIGRMAVTVMVAGFVVFALMQSKIVGRGALSHEGIVCGGIYVGVMAVIAGIMA